MFVDLKVAATNSTYIMETGNNRAIRVWIERQETEDGGVCCSLVSEDGEVLGCWWEGGPKKRRQGRKTRYCLGPDYDKLTERQRLAVASLRGHILNDGRIKSRKRNREGRKAELEALLGSAWTLRGLKEAGAISEKDGWFYLDRRFLFRG